MNKHFNVPTRHVLIAVLLSLLLADAGNLRAQGAAAVQVTFKNTSTRLLTINSVAPGQAARAIAQVKPGQTAVVPSAPGQIWVLLNVNNHNFGEYRATREPRQIYTITQDGGFAGPAGAANKGPAPVPATPGNPAIAATGSKLTKLQAERMVDYHNQKRAEVRSGNVTWSPQIAKYAQQRADTIARTKQLAHLPQGQNPYGENLASGGSTGGAAAYSVINACEGWYAEKAKMPRNVRTMTMELFNRGVGHYTQMMWKGSTQIGAGIAQYQQGGLTMTVVVCCYNPPGNVLNQAIY